ALASNPRIRRGLSLDPSDKVSRAEHAVDDSQPRKRHWVIRVSPSSFVLGLSSLVGAPAPRLECSLPQPGASKRLLRCRYLTAKRFGGHHLNPRILSQRDIRYGRRATPTPDPHRIRIASFVTSKHSGKVLCGCDSGPVQLPHDIVDVEAGLVSRSICERRGTDSRAVSRLDADVAPPRPSRVRAAYRETGRLNQLREIRNLSTVNVFREELMREAGVATDLRQTALGIVDGVRTVDVPFTRATRFAVDTPHRTHEIVERDAAVGPAAQRQIECERNGA